MHLGFHVAKDGRVLDVAVLRGSGYVALDGAAAGMLRGARLPAFPEEIMEPELMVTVIIDYSLDR